MGTDCSVKVGDKYTSLDRWYVFSSGVESGRPMTKDETLAVLRKLLNKENLKSQTDMWKERRKEFRKYHRHWILVAKRAAKAAGEYDKIIFYADHDLPENYWEQGL